GTGLADQRHPLPGPDCEIQAVDHPDRAGRGVEVDLEIADVEQVGHDVPPPRRLGSLRTRSRSPTRLKAIAVSAIAAPGMATTHQALTTWSRPAATSAPHSADGVWAPTPMKDRPEITRITAATSMVIWTYRVSSEFGRMCRRIRRQRGTPTDRAASTYSWCRVSRTRVRTRRAYPGHQVRESATTAEVRLGPSAAARPSARIIGGNDSPMSQIRIRISSTIRPPNAASVPSTTPITVAAAITIAVANRVTRAPARTRLNTSRPSASVPNQWSVLGGSRLLLRSTW